MSFLIQIKHNKIKKTISSFLKILSNDGLYQTIKTTIRWLFKSDPILKKRLLLSEQINTAFSGIVKYGPLKGFKFSKDSWWGAYDRGSMLLGIYEKEVLISLQSIPKRYRYFIDVGAADGYYGVGVIVGNLFEKSWCYEISEEGQQTIKKNAELNKVSHRVEVRGKADLNFEKEFSSAEASISVLFIDIEGAEFELLNTGLFEKFKNSIIFIELHDWFFPDGEERLNILKQNAEKFFKISTLTTTSRDLSVFEELKGMNDTDRWLICSEGRGRLMTWWRLDPLEE
jgi:hypothetical protein